MFTQRLMIAIAVAALCTLLSNNARADLVTFDVTGYVTTFHADPPIGWSVPMGAPFYGTFTFETTIADYFPDDPTIGQYINSITSSSFWLGFDPVVETEHNGIVDSDIRVTNDRDGSDAYTVVDWSVAFRGYDVNVGLFLRDHTMTAFDDDFLLVVPPSLEVFSYNRWHILDDTNKFVVAGTITSLTRMPEPTTALLLLGGTVVLLRRTHRR